MPSKDNLTRRTLGRTGYSVGRVGLGSSFGLGAKGVERAYHELGVNYLYWGSVPRPSFGRGIRSLARQHRSDLVVVLQSYARLGTLVKASVHVGLKRLRLEYADVLLLGMYNQPPSERIFDAAMKLVEDGVVRHVAISCHKRPTFQTYLEDDRLEIFHVRYNAAHRGAEHEVFEQVDAAGDRRPGVVAFTATRWGTLLEPKAAPEGEPHPSAADCYRFALSHPTVDVVLAGPANEQQLEAVAEAVRRGPMDEEELAWMRRVGEYVYQNQGLFKRRQ